MGNHSNIIRDLFLELMTDRCDIKLLVTISLNKNNLNSFIKNVNSENLRKFQLWTFKDAARRTYRNTNTKPEHYPAVLSLIETADKYGNPCFPHFHAALSARDSDLDRHKANIEYYAKKNGLRLFDTAPHVQFDEVYDTEGLFDYIFKNVDHEYDILDDILFYIPESRSAIRTLH